MTNEPFYRIWNREKKRYVNYFGHELIVLDNGCICRLSEPNEPFTLMYLDKDQYIVERCTGLKASAGRWIFEGDKIRYKFVFNKTSYATVVFKNGCFYAQENVLLKDIDNITITGTMHDENSQD